MSQSAALRCVFVAGDTTRLPCSSRRSQAAARDADGGGPGCGGFTRLNGTICVLGCRRGCRPCPAWLQVSFAHALIFADGGRHRVRDLGSRRERSLTANSWRTKPTPPRQCDPHRALSVAVRTSGQCIRLGNAGGVSSCTSGTSRSLWTTRRSRRWSRAGRDLVSAPKSQRTNPRKPVTLSPTVSTEPQRQKQTTPTSARPQLKPFRIKGEAGSRGVVLRRTRRRSPTRRRLRIRNPSGHDRAVAAGGAARSSVTPQAPPHCPPAPHRRPGYPCTTASGLGGWNPPPPFGNQPVAFAASEVVPVPPRRAGRPPPSRKRSTLRTPIRAGRSTPGRTGDVVTTPWPRKKSAARRANRVRQCLWDATVGVGTTDCVNGRINPQVDLVEAMPPPR